MILAVSIVTNIADHVAKSKNISSHIMKPVGIVVVENWMQIAGITGGPQRLDC
jgi:hypothetical protein